MIKAMINGLITAGLVFGLSLLAPFLLTALGKGLIMLGMLAGTVSTYSPGFYVIITGIIAILCGLRSFIGTK